MTDKSTGETKVVVTPMKRSHLPQVLELARQLGYENMLGGLTARFEKLRRDKEQRLFVAIVNGQVVGWIHFCPRKLLQAEFRLEVLALVVDSRLRRRGIGKLLLLTAQRSAADNGLGMVALYSGDKRREAHLFYRKLGYKNSKNAKVFVKIIRV